MSCARRCARRARLRVLRACIGLRWVSVSCNGKCLGIRRRSMRLGGRCAASVTSGCVSLSCSSRLSSARSPETNRTPENTPLQLHAPSHQAFWPMGRGGQRGGRGRRRTQSLRGGSPSPGTDTAASIIWGKRRMHIGGGCSWASTSRFGSSRIVANHM